MRRAGMDERLLSDDREAVRRQSETLECRLLLEPKIISQESTSAGHSWLENLQEILRISRKES
jgi:hypothetical protein